MIQKQVRYVPSAHFLYSQYFFAACVNDSLLFDASSVNLCLVTMTIVDHKKEDERVFICSCRHTLSVFLVTTIIAFILV